MIENRELLLFCSALRAELGSCFQFYAAVLTEFFGSERLAALRTELPTTDLCSTMWARGDNRLLEFVGFYVADLRGFHASIINGCIHLDGGVFLLKVWRAILAKSPVRIPAVIIHPVTAAFAFMEMWLGFLHGFRECIVMCFFPRCRANIACRVRCTPKYPSKEIAGSIESTGYSP
jgi:hypothetical protein